MFCPKCRAEFVEGITVCSDCGIPLVKELPPEPKTEYRELIEVFSTSKGFETGIIKSLLESEGIKCFVQNIHYPSLTGAGIAVPIKIMVGEEDKNKPEKVIKDYYGNIKK